MGEGTGRWKVLSVDDGKREAEGLWHSLPPGRDPAMFHTFMSYCKYRASVASVKERRHHSMGVTSKFTSSPLPGQHVAVISMCLVADK